MNICYNINIIPIITIIFICWTCCFVRFMCSIYHVFAVVYIKNTWNIISFITFFINAPTQIEMLKILFYSCCACSNNYVIIIAISIF